MPKANPVSLHPLSFEEAIKALMHTSSKRGELSAKIKSSKGPPISKNKKR